MSTPTDLEPPALESEQLALVDLLDRLMTGGVVLTGDLTLSVAGVDLVYLGLRVVLSSVDALDANRGGQGAA